MRNRSSQVVQGFPNVTQIQRQGPGSSSDVAEVRLGFSRAQGDTIKSSVVPEDRSLSEEESWTRASNCQSKGLSAIQYRQGKAQHPLGPTKIKV